MENGKHAYRIFLSSPGDVNYEREIVREEIHSLFENSEFSDRLEVELVSWDNPDAPSPLIANQTPQATLKRQMLEPAECDLVVVIFWARMGTALPSGEFRKANGEVYHSGTEWEFENALHSPKQPNILLYRRIDPIELSPDNAEYEPSLEQQSLVNQFFKRLESNDGSLKGFCNKYRGSKNFRSQFRNDLVGVLKMEYPDRDSKQSSLRSSLNKPTLKCNPYMGLAPYSELQADVFYGRDDEIDVLEDKIRNGINCVAIVGASGSGKSSLALAGLIPRLRKSHERGGVDYHYLLTQPSAPDFLTEFLDQQTNQAWASIIDGLLTDKKSNERLLVVIDQAEELLKFSVEEQDRVASVLNQLIASSRVSLVLTCRTDLYADVVDLCDDGMRAYLQENTFILAAPSVENMIDIIRQPARAAGISVDDKVVGRILKSFEGNRNALPLVSFLLEQLYQTSDDHQCFDLTAYNKAGGVEGVVKNSAEKVYTSLSPAASQKMITVFSRLLSIDSHNRVTKEPCLMSLFQEDKGACELIEVFLDARLLTVNHRENRDSVFEITHESLIVSWPRLNDIAQQQSEQIKWQKRFSAGVNRWLEGGRQGGDLLQGAELDGCVERLRTEAVHLSPEEQEYLSASSNKRRSIEKRIALLGTLPVLTVCFLMVVLVGVVVVSSLDAIKLLQGQTHSVAQDLVNQMAFSSAEEVKRNDLGRLESIVNVMFDSGSYQSITVRSAEGETLVHKQGQQKLTDIEQWLLSLTQLRSIRANAELHSGWLRVGEISVVPEIYALLLLLKSNLQKYLLAIAVFLIVIVPFLWFSFRQLKNLRKSIS